VKKLLLLAGALAVLFCGPLACADSLKMKPVITGFIDMQDINWHNTDDSQPVFTMAHVEQFPGLFGGIVLNLTWNEMQPRRYGALETARLDNALAQVRAYNARHSGAPLGVKLRIFSGNQAPPWAKGLDGGPLTIQRNAQGCQTPNPPGCPITIGKVWSRQYIAAWRLFQIRVAARYDSEPLIRAVAITSCSMETDEPFVMPTGQAIGGGYTDAAQQACLAGAVNDYGAWHRSVIDYTFNTFVSLQGGKPDLAFTLSVMNACRTSLGPHCELGNHAFAAVMRAGNIAVVNAIAARGPPIHFQTAGPKGLNWAATMQLARTDNATAIELWPDFGGFTTFSTAKMKHLLALFEDTAQ
jgi:hypothetical protein